MKARTMLRMSWACVLVIGAATGVAGCGSASQSGSATSAPRMGEVAENITHEACNDSGRKVELLDSKGDGKADIKKVEDGSGHEICRVTDINHDGKADLYEYFDSNGAVRRREADYDENGVIDSVETYEDGKLVKREYDTTGQHRVDTWDFFDKATGKRVRRERDTTNDGRVDQWWTWDGDKVTIAMDRDGDGKPDPASTIVLGAKPVDAKTAPAASASSAAAPASSAPPPAASSSAVAAPSPPAPPRAPAPAASSPAKGGHK